MLVASATIDGHAVALRLERADTLTIRRWVDVRPVMPRCQERTVVRTPNSRDTLLTAAREGLASRGYDATNRRRARRRNRDEQGSGQLPLPNQDWRQCVSFEVDNLRDSVEVGVAAEQRGPASPGSSATPMSAADDAKRPAKRLDAVVRRRISICQLAPELG